MARGVLYPITIVGTPTLTRSTLVFEALRDVVDERTPEMRWGNRAAKTATKRAVLEGVVLAETENAVSLEGNAYFPPDSIRWELLVANDHTTVCPWKGRAGYFDAVIDGEVHRNVGWTYRTPSDKAAGIAEHVAFWGKVKVE
jgi:uncharacterized protein (DUF427 family)